MQARPSSSATPNVCEMLATGQIDLVINVRDSKANDDSISDGYLIRRKAVDFSVCLLTDVKLSVLLIHALWRRHNHAAPKLLAWDEFGAA